MNLSVWSPDLVLGNAAMDGAHRAVYNALAALSGAPAREFRTAYLAFVAALEREFRIEEDVMERIGYPGLPAHREQHARALSGLHHAQAALEEGDPHTARHSIELLADWLHLHILTMDQALATAWSVAQHRPKDRA